MSLELRAHPDRDWAHVVASDLSEFLAANPGARVCLATGRTTSAVYQRTVVTGAPELFLLDEFGGLASDDPARCANMLRRDLPGVPFLGPDVDAADSEAAATAYGGQIANGGLDLAVVGLGVNGHIGMNEPGSGPEDPTRVVRLAPETSLGASKYGAETSPIWGITVGMAELLAAKELWLVVSGGHKARILARALEGDVGPEVPAGSLRRHHNGVVIADESAVSLLRR